MGLPFLLQEVLEEARFFEVAIEDQRDDLVPVAGQVDAVGMEVALFHFIGWKAVEGGE